MKTFVIILSTLLFGCTKISAASSQPECVKDSLPIYFKAGQSYIDLSYVDNAAQLSTLKYKIKRLFNEGTIKKYRIRVTSGASPEGPNSLNDNLAVTRAKAIVEALAESTPLTKRDIDLRIQGVDWKTLIELVRTSRNMPYKEEMLNLLQNTPEKVVNRSVDVYLRKERMENLYGGVPYQWMYDHLFKRLRYASVVIDTCQTSKLQVVRDTIQLPGDTVVNTVIMPRNTDNLADAKKSEYFFAVKTNALYDALALPNLGLEFYLKDNWSITGNWSYSAWKNDDKHRYWSIYGGDLGVRKWFGRQAELRPLSGHHVGFFVQGLNYDIEFGGKGYLSDTWNLGASFEYGFSLPITKRINFDFSVGLGYFGGKNKKYRPKNINERDEYVWLENNHFNWFGPTKVEASLVILLGKGINK